MFNWLRKIFMNDEEKDEFDERKDILEETETLRKESIFLRKSLRAYERRLRERVKNREVKIQISRLSLTPAVPTPSPTPVAPVTPVTPVAPVAPVAPATPSSSPTPSILVVPPPSVPRPPPPTIEVISVLIDGAVNQIDSAKARVLRWRNNLSQSNKDSIRRNVESAIKHSEDVVTLLPQNIQQSMKTSLQDMKTKLEGLIVLAEQKGVIVPNP